MTRGSRTASDVLTRALLNLANRGGRPRCSDPGTHQLWLSEDAAERALAATWCAGCPVLAECRDAAAANGERFGVWGGVDRTRKPVRQPT